ncbi:MAG: S16 family serine protease [Candidatus Pacearchaeota archaeon]
MAKVKRRKKKIKKEPEKEKRKESKNYGDYIVIVIIALIVLTIIFLAITYSKISRLEGLKEKVTGETKPIDFTVKQPLFNSTQATAFLPAVDNEGNGVITLLAVEAVKGSGRTLVDIDNLLFWGDTQHSIRIAKNVAENITGVDISNYDIVYNIYANASIIGGESAGAAITLATIAVLQNKSLRDDVIITGTINHDGSIGPVQAILPKAKAAKANNATIFLVPVLQSREVTYETRKHCEKFGVTEYCTEEQVPVRVNVSEEAGIQVIEVSTISEAMQYFFKE